MNPFSKTINIRNFWNINILYQSRTRLRPMFSFQNFQSISLFPLNQQDKMLHTLVRKYSGSVSLSVSYLSKFDFMEDLILSYFCTAVTLYCYHILEEGEIRYPESSPAIIDYNDEDQYQTYVKNIIDLDL